ncbi:5'-3' exoribonuclease 3-like isoform X2 [Lolium perenne]|uniref:5'-3' exoribonuclease 3-like isoform X2 n=1 Tax=Lolium perenne TaxID=4522 RepID=UPI0021F5523D|nr:5'-3' exoribonuclease 2-like isoform X2 [Lolium perenne]
MGIPSFFSWLIGKYPNIVTPTIAAWKEDDDDEEEEEEDEEGEGGEEDEEEEEEEDKEGEEEDDDCIFDNLYLDMNEIIYKCFRMNNGLVYHWFFDYMDRLFLMVRPRKLLYLAVDGVAPMAKMNKLRQAYFKSAKHATDAEAEAILLTEIFRAKGKEVLPRDKYELEDHTVKMPGTEFMEKISVLLEYYIRKRLNTDPKWKDIKVILSDANVPGEAEHKIMSFIRAQRSMENYDPNTYHCLYGHDADLIMLALASHEVHMSILREVGNSSMIPARLYQYVDMWVLREYLELEMKTPDCKQDTERLIDDFIFICFFMGNDFIPRIPSLEINEFGVDLLIEVYKTTFNKMGGYIVNTDKIKDNHGAYLQVSRLEKFFDELSLCEEKILLKRYELREHLLCKIQREAAETEWNERSSDSLEESPDGSYSTCMLFLKQGSARTFSGTNVIKNTRELWRTARTVCHNKGDLFRKRACTQDRLRPGWKSRFCREKSGAETSNEAGWLQPEMVQKYLEGLCWMLRCYFSEVPSWTWCYPFYYSPLACDFKCLSQFKVSFTVDKPLRPFDQLMAILPPEKHVLSCALPACYIKLIDCEESTIRIFYPSEFEMDADGKRFLSQTNKWLQGVAKLPFVDKELLLSATKTVEKELTEDEMRRNNIRQERIFLRCSHSLANHAAFVPTSESPQKRLPICTSEIGGWFSPEEEFQTFASRRDQVNCSYIWPIDPDMSVSAMFFNPEAVKPISRLLEGVIVPDKTVTEADIRKRPLWHTYPGPRLPTVAHRPETLGQWKAMPREEHKSGGEGWLGRGRGGTAAVAEAQQIGSNSSYGRARGGGYGRGSRGVDMAQSPRLDSGGECVSRPGLAWAGGVGGPPALQRQQTEGRQVGLWARGGGNPMRRTAD